MKKVLAIILIIISFIGGLFIGINQTKGYDEIPKNVIEKDYPIRDFPNKDFPTQALYGCPMAKKVKKPMIKRKYIKLF